MEAITDIQTLNNTAGRVGLSHCRWATLAGINRPRLSMAVNGHLQLRNFELELAAEALRRHLNERVSTFNQILETFPPSTQAVA